MASRRHAAQTKPPRIFADGLDGILDGPTGGLARPTPIADALTGAIIRA